MEALQASIFSAIKAIRSSKKRADELTVYKFIKREFQSITNEETTEKYSYLLIDNFNIVDSRPHIHTTMATPIIEKSASAKILPPAIENEIDSFITSDDES